MKEQSFPGVPETKDGMDLDHLTINLFGKDFVNPLCAETSGAEGRKRSRLCPGGTFSQLSTYCVPGTYKNDVK